MPPLPLPTRPILPDGALMSLVFFLACSDYDVNLDGKPDPAYDSSGGDSAPVETGGDSGTPEACNGLDDDGDGAVDEDFEDLDGDGVADCLVFDCPALELGVAGPASAEACLGAPTVPDTPVDDPWSYTLEWTFESPTPAYAAVTTPAVGNLDDDNGDGLVDHNDVPEVAIVGGEVAYALDGATGALKWEIRDVNPFTGPVIADVDADGRPDLLLVSWYGQLVLYDGNGVETRRSTSRVSWAASVSVADLDGDGLPEVVCGNEIYAGETLTREAILPEPRTEWTFAAIADVDRDGDQEIFWDGALYDHDGTVIWDAHPPVGIGSFPALVQADADDAAELAYLSDRYMLFDTDGTVLAEGAPFPDSTSGTGLPTAGDFDGDGEMEIAYPRYYDGPFTMTELDGTIGWEVEGPWRTYGAGASSFDFDGDGALDIVYPADEALYVYDGRTGAAVLVDEGHRSPTDLEFAVVADVDADGHAEIVMVSPSIGLGEVRVLGHAGEGWPAAGPTWSQNDFSVVNVSADGVVPARPDASWLTNKVYRGRTAVDGTPATADLRVDITDVCVADCTYGGVAVAVQVENLGGLEADAGATLSLYALDGSPRLVASQTLPAIPAGQALDGIQFDLRPVDIGSGGFAAVVDDAGVVPECDETNNEGRWEDGYCP